MNILLLTVLDPNADDEDSELVGSSVYKDREALVRHLLQGWDNELEFDCQFAPEEERIELQEAYRETKADFLKFWEENGQFGGETAWRNNHSGHNYVFTILKVQE